MGRRAALGAHAGGAPAMPAFLCRGKPSPIPERARIQRATVLQEARPMACALVARAVLRGPVAQRKCGDERA